MTTAILEREGPVRDVACVISLQEVDDWNDDERGRDGKFVHGPDEEGACRWMGWSHDGCESRTADESCGV